MPCYDERGSGRVHTVTPREYRHNSPVASMLCYILRRHPELATTKELRQWWREHQERDRKEGKS